ncbi:MAG TPA: hypothetical protein PJ986_20390 [Gammaproteobacteria bacterium]|nr:hypothetical protein [Gammaproteobacteria bacterium]
MSLINQMLCDLEARKGGRLGHVDAALDGLHAVPLRAVGERPRAMLGALLVFSACAALWASRTPLLDSLRLALPAPALRAAIHPAPVAPIVTPAPAPRATAPAPVAVNPVVVLEAPPPVEALSPAEFDVALPPVTAPALPLEPSVPVQAPPPVVQKPAPVAERAAPAGLQPIYLDDEGNEIERGARTREKAPRRPPAIAARQQAQVEYPGSFRREATTAPAVSPQAQRLAEIDAMFANGDRERALQALRAFVLAAPAEEGARERLALALIADRRVTEAEALLRAGLRLAPASTRLAQPLGHLLLAQAQPEAALAVLRPATPPLAGHAEFHALLAAAEQRTGAHGLAITRYRGLLKEQPLNGGWLVGLGISLLAVDERADAQATFARALADRALPEPLRAYAARELVRLKDAVQ